MIKNENAVESLTLDDNVKQNNKGEVILGRLEGPCADFINPTRNERMYDEDLWEKIFSDPLINEWFDAGGIPGELDHPLDRLDTCSEKIAVMMPEKPKKDKNGHLIAKFDILNTPNGKITYTLAKYGFKLGISSRGDGETYKDYKDGNEHVNSDTYQFKAFDIVLLPAVKAARLKMVESLNNNSSITLKTALCEALESAKPEEKKVMEETLKNLNIEYTPEKVIDKKDNSNAASDTGASVIKELQESLLKQQALNAQVIELQEKLSVCYAKEAKYAEDITTFKSTIRNLTESVKNAKAVQTKLDTINEELKSKNVEMQVEKNKHQRLVEDLDTKNLKSQQLKESLMQKDILLEKANKKIDQLNENLIQEQNQSKEMKEDLQEKLANMQKNLDIKTNLYKNKLTESNKLIESYQEIAKSAVNRYIDSKALALGVNSQEIKNKLTENYSFKDIDMICEELSKYKLNISTLPFNLAETTISLKESKEPIMPKSRFDDSVDESLLKMAKIN